MSLPHGIVLISDREMQEQWMEFLTPYSFGYASNSFAIAAVTAAAGGAADAWLDQVNAYLYENRELFLAEAKRRKLPIRPDFFTGSTAGNPKSCRNCWENDLWKKRGSV